MQPIILGESGSGSWEGTTSGGLTIAAATDAGFNYKPVNEDRIVIGDDFAAVIDGMGGHSGGERAAQIVAEEIASTPADMPGALHRASVRMQREDDARDVYSGKAGACVMTARVLRDRNALTVKSYQAGDVKRIIAHQRSLLGQRGGPLSFDESSDQGLVGSLVASGVITPEEAKTHAYRNVVLNYICKEEPKASYSATNIHQGDAVLLYSDGVSDNLSVEEIIRMGTAKTVSELLKAVWDATEEKMTNHKRYPKGEAKPDNRSFVAIDVK